MVLAMPRPTTRKGTQNSQFRMRVPPDLVEQAKGRVVVFDFPAIGSLRSRVATVTVGNEIKVTLGTSERGAAKARFASAQNQAQRFLASLRADFERLSQKQVAALSGEVYRLIVERFEDDPGSPSAWAAWKAFNRAAKEGRIASAPAILWDAVPDEFGAAEMTFGPDLTAGIDALPIAAPTGALEQRFGNLVSWVLAKHQIVPTPASRLALLNAVADAAQDAGYQVKRYAIGDWTPDPKAQRFPPIAAVRKPVSVADLFSKWQDENKPSASTISTWNGVVKSFEDHLGAKKDDAATIYPEDVIAWKDALVAKDLQHRTISGSYLAAINAVFNHAVANRLLAANPAANVKVARQKRAGQSQLPYTDDEVRTLLLLARKETSAYRRWLPWLCAATGARVGELAQLWGTSVVDGVLRITPAPDGGSIKNESSERDVPIHSELIAEGFLDFVKSKGQGPLFYRRSSGKSGKKHASKGTANHLANWIRQQDGFQDARKAPAHAFRHWFKSAAVRVGISDSMADALQGHTTPGVASRHRHFDVKTKAEAIEKMRLLP